MLVSHDAPREGKTSTTAPCASCARRAHLDDDALLAALVMLPGEPGQDDPVGALLSALAEDLGEVSSLLTHGVHPEGVAALDLCAERIALAASVRERRLRRSPVEPTGQPSDAEELHLGAAGVRREALAASRGPFRCVERRLAKVRSRASAARRDTSPLEKRQRALDEALTELRSAVDELDAMPAVLRHGYLTSTPGAKVRAERHQRACDLARMLEVELRQIALLIAADAARGGA